MIFVKQVPENIKITVKSNIVKINSWSIIVTLILIFVPTTNEQQINLIGHYH